MPRLALLTLALAVPLAGCEADAPPDPPPAAPAVAAPQQPDGLLALAELNSSLSRFSQAVDRAGLTETLSAEGPFTVFAPSDAAFREAGGLDALAADPDALAERLLGHVVPTRMLAVDIFAPITIETVAGTEIEVDASPDGRVTVRGSGGTATVGAADLDASNGVIHIIDSLL